MIHNSMKKTYNQFTEEVAANSMGGGGFNVGQAAQTGSPYLSGIDLPFGTMKKRKKKNESFAGCPVFTVSNDDYAKCMHGRMRYERWNKKLNMEEIENQEIRTYAHRNPGQPIIVKDDRYGTMSYFVPPKQEVSESVEVKQPVKQSVEVKQPVKQDKKSSYKDHGNLDAYVADRWKKLQDHVEVDESSILRRLKMDKFSRSERKRKKDNTKKIRKYQKMVGISSEVEYDGESLDERNKTDIPANKQTKDIIQSGKAKILINVLSSIHKNARFVVIQRPLGHRGNLSSNQDKVLMATISDPKKGRIKMFSYHGTHINHQGAMKFAKTNKLVATKDAKGNPLYAKESVELDEYSATRDAASQDAKWMMSVGTKKNKKTPAGKTIQRIQRKLNRGPLSGPSARGRAR